MRAQRDDTGNDSAFRCVRPRTNSLGSVADDVDMFKPKSRAPPSGVSSRAVSPVKAMAMAPSRVVSPGSDMFASKSRAPRSGVSSRAVSPVKAMAMAPSRVVSPGSGMFESSVVREMAMAPSRVVSPGSGMFKPMARAPSVVREMAMAPSMRGTPVGTERPGSNEMFGPRLSQSPIDSGVSERPSHTPPDKGRQSTQPRKQLPRAPAINADLTSRFGKTEFSPENWKHLAVSLSLAPTQEPKFEIIDDVHVPQLVPQCRLGRDLPLNITNDALEIDKYIMTKEDYEREIRDVSSPYATVRHWVHVIACMHKSRLIKDFTNFPSVCVMEIMANQEYLDSTLFVQFIEFYYPGRKSNKPKPLVITGPLAHDEQSTKFHPGHFVVTGSAEYWTELCYPVPKTLNIWGLGFIDNLLKVEKNQEFRGMIQAYIDVCSRRSFQTCVLFRNCFKTAESETLKRKVAEFYAIMGNTVDEFSKLTMFLCHGNKSDDICKYLSIMESMHTHIRSVGLPDRKRLADLLPVVLNPRKARVERHLAIDLDKIPASLAKGKECLEALEELLQGDNSRWEGNANQVLKHVSLKLEVKKYPNGWKLINLFESLKRGNHNMIIDLIDLARSFGQHVYNHVETASDDRIELDMFVKPIVFTDKIDIMYAYEGCKDVFFAGVLNMAYKEGVTWGSKPMDSMGNASVHIAAMIGDELILRSCVQEFKIQFEGCCRETPLDWKSHTEKLAPQFVHGLYNDVAASFFMGFLHGLKGRSWVNEVVNMKGMRYEPIEESYYTLKCMELDVTQIDPTEFLAREKDCLKDAMGLKLNTDRLDEFNVNVLVTKGDDRFIYNQGQLYEVSCIDWMFSTLRQLSPLTLLGRLPNGKIPVESEKINVLMKYMIPYVWNKPYCRKSEPVFINIAVWASSHLDWPFIPNHLWVPAMIKHFSDDLDEPMSPQEFFDYVVVNGPNKDEMDVADIVLNKFQRTIFDEAFVQDVIVSLSWMFEEKHYGDLESIEFTLSHLTSGVSRQRDTIFLDLEEAWKKNEVFLVNKLGVDLGAIPEVDYEI